MAGAWHFDRRQEILRYIDPGTRGIEIAPWFNPILSPRGDREVVVLDIFDRPALVARAENDPHIDDMMIPRIGEVDLVGSACDIAELTRARFGPEARFDFVVSSHNLEHLPDPVRFLRGCEELLASGGVIAMAVPDKRACFDYFRPCSGTGELLQAFHERRQRPSLAQVFSQGAYASMMQSRSGKSGAFTIDDNPNSIALVGDVVQAYTLWAGRIDPCDTVYRDTHCWTFTPSSLELIFTELILLGLINFDIVSISGQVGCEFIVHLRKRLEGAAAQSSLAERRELLLRQTVDDLAYMSPYAWGLRRAASRNLALGQSATQSSLSTWSIGATPEEDAGGAVTGHPTGRYAFHTALEDAPWWMVDLGRERTIEEIRLFNRSDDAGLAARARRLELAVSLDREIWRVVLRKEDESVFGGVEGTPLSVSLEPTVQARYVRVQLTCRDYLHLDQVEVCGF
jgi:predicted SAM-dependent methyltransferase